MGETLAEILKTADIETIATAIAESGQFDRIRDHLNYLAEVEAYGQDEADEIRAARGAPGGGA